MDESGCFFKVLPSKGLAQKWKKCKGGKKSNQKIAVALLFLLVPMVVKSISQYSHLEGKAKNHAGLNIQTPHQNLS